MEQLLALLTERRPLPYTVTAGEFWLLLSTDDEDLSVKLVSPELGRLLKAIEAQNATLSSIEEIEELIEAGLITVV